jgi:alkylhydroperoxidase family enzyme
VARPQTSSGRARVYVEAEPSALARRLMADAAEHGTPHPDVYRVLDSVPELMLTFHDHWRAMFDRGVVELDLKELVRRKIANYSECVTCESVAVAGQEADLDEKLAASYAWRDTPLLSDREKAAMWLVDFVVGVEPDADSVYEELHRHFTDAELIELGWFAAFNAGTVPFVRSWRLHEDPTE